MPKLYLPLFLLLCCVSFVQAQEGYIRLGGGYSIAASNDVFSNTVVERDSNNRYTLDRNIYGSLGSGARIQLCGGYVFKQNFGFELDVHYLLGQRKTAAQSTSPYQENNTFAYTQQFRISPSFFVRADAGPVQPYAGMGVVIPALGKTTVEEQVTTSTDYEFRERAIFGSFSLGFESYAGLNIKWPNENFNLFVEFRYTGLRIKSKDAKTLQWTRTNLNTEEVVDVLETAQIFETDFIFRDELTQESNTFTATVISSQFDFEKPLELLATKTNFNAIGLNIGVCMKFAKKPAEEAPAD